MNKKILNLALPNVISNISIPLLGMVDLALLGHLESEVYIGALALGTMIFNFIYWGFAFLRMGTSGLTAQALGSRNLKECIAILTRSVLLAIAIALFIIVLQYPIAKISFFIVEGSASVEKYARQYFFIRIYAAPASLALYAITGWFLGMQNAKSPMIISIVINVLNIVFNVIFVYGLGMKSDGVALGTVLAQYAGLFVSGIIVFRYYRKLFKYWSYTATIVIQKLKLFFKVNTDIFFRLVCVIFVFSFFTTQSANTGDTILAVNTLLLQFLMFFSYLIDGVAYAAEALVGKYVGANSCRLLKKSVKYLFLWGAIITGVFSVVYFFADNIVLRLLTDNNTVLDKANTYLLWIWLIPVFSFAGFVWDGVYIGATATRNMLYSLLISTVLVFIPTFYLTKNVIGNHGLWLAMLLFMASRGIFLTIRSPKAIFNLVSKPREEKEGSKQP